MFDDVEFDVEHALMMHAARYVHMHAKDIYEEEVLDHFKEEIKNCHIYIIGASPKLKFIRASECVGIVSCCYEMLGRRYDISLPLPKGARFTFDSLGGVALENKNFQRFWFNSEAIYYEISKQYGSIDCEVLYVGQAYGKDGRRNAVDRLKKHETLQKIALSGIPEGRFLHLFLIQVNKSSRLCTVFNPHAKNKEQGGERIEAGIDFAFDVSEAELVTLFEASIIRYFQPRYNKEFKDSFPSSNMKCLSRCYDKDISAIISEIVFENTPIVFFSNSVKAKVEHVAKFDLHKEEDRKTFFNV